jgi:hypothetical protein
VLGTSADAIETASGSSTPGISKVSSWLASRVAGM